MMGLINLRRCALALCLLLTLFAPSLSHAATASSGQQIDGSILSPTIDSYTFSIPPTGTIWLSAWERAPTGGQLFPAIKLFNPVGTLTSQSQGQYYIQNYWTANTYGSGTWTAQVTGGFGMAASNYTFQMLRIPGQNAICCGQSGGTIYPGQTYSGSNTGGSMDVYMLYSSAASNILDGPRVTLTQTGTSGGTNFATTAYFHYSSGQMTTSGGVNTVFPTGSFYAGASGFPVTAGIYYLLVQHGGADLAGSSTYTITLDGKSMLLPPEAKADGAYCEDCHVGGAMAGDPITIATGNLYESMTDYTTVGTNPLAFKRYYNSLSRSHNLYPTALGPNWRSNYDRYLRFISGYDSLMAAERESGQVINFTSVGGVWKPDSDVDMTLFSSGSNWILTDSNDTVETYFASAGKGLLSSVKARNGYTQTLSYSSSLLASVTDSYGRGLGLTYSSTSGMLTGVTTPDPLVLSYGYTIFASAATLSSVSYNTSPVTSQAYLYENASFPYALTGITDENGKRYNTWTYDAQGRATSSQFASAAGLTSVSYDDSTGNRTVTGPLGIAETYKFSTLQTLPKVIEVDRASGPMVSSASRFMNYDANGYLNTQTDWNGNQTAYTNNTHGDPTTIVYASGSAVSHTTTIAYDPTFVHLPKTITEPDRITTLTYDSSGNVLTRSIKDIAGQSMPYFTSGTVRNWTYTWSNTGQLLTAQLPRTDVTAKTTLTYSSVGALKTVTDALSHVTTVLTFRSGGLPLTITDPNSVLTTLTYTNRNWLTSSVLTLSSGGTLTTNLTYDSAGNLTRYTLPDASYLNYTYDNAHRLTGITNALSEFKTLTLDSAGNVTQEIWKDASSVTKRQHSASFDGLSRQTTDVGGMGQSTAFSYDNNGNVISVTDPLMSVTTLQFDSLNRVKSSKDALTNLTQYTYNSHDAVLSVTDPRSHATNYTYDGFGEMIQEVSPDRGTTILKFDSDGNVSQQTDANAFVTNMTYDALDRILTRTYPADSTLNVAFAYDQTGHGKGILHLTSATDQIGNLSLNYEERGLLTANNRTMTGGNAYNTLFSYESAGRLSTLTYASSGWMVAYARDAAGQVTAVTDKPPSLTAVNIATSITHLPFGPVKSMTYANGVTDTRTFDLDYRMTSVKDVGTGNIQYSSYGYNANNSLTSLLDNVTPANNQTLQYNSADWLNFASGSYGTGINLTYDSAGNRTAYGATTYTMVGTNNRLNTTAGNAVTYTSAGNISAIATGPTFTYNKANQMATAVVSGTTSTYGYDAFGQRLKAQVGTTPVRILSYLGSDVLTESSAGTKTDYIYVDDMPIGVLQPAASTVSYIHTDYLGTPQKASDASKTVVWNGAYNPNGLVTPTTTINMNLRNRGQIQDVTGFYHNGYRDYNPVTAYGTPRYLQMDPIGLAGGINPFIYVNNNPFKYIDPWGLETPSVSLDSPLNGPAYPDPPPFRPTLPPSVSCPPIQKQCASDPNFKPYFGNPNIYHCGGTGYTQVNTPGGHQTQECFYDAQGNLDTTACGGSPDDYDAHRYPVMHGLSDRGGPYYPFFPAETDVGKKGKEVSKERQRSQKGRQ